jgi:hypothetical protein
MNTYTPKELLNIIEKLHAFGIAVKQAIGNPYSDSHKSLLANGLCLNINRICPDTDVVEFFCTVMLRGMKYPFNDNDATKYRHEVLDGTLYKNKHRLQFIHMMANRELLTEYVEFSLRQIEFFEQADAYLAKFCRLVRRKHRDRLTEDEAIKYAEMDINKHSLCACLNTYNRIAEGNVRNLRHYLHCVLFNGEDLPFNENSSEFREEGDNGARMLNQKRLKFLIDMQYRRTRSVMHNKYLLKNGFLWRFAEYTRSSDFPNNEQ